MYWHLEVGFVLEKVRFPQSGEIIHQSVECVESERERGEKERYLVNSQRMDCFSSIEVTGSTMLHHSTLE